VAAITTRPAPARHRFRGGITGIGGSYRLTGMATGTYTVMFDPDCGGTDQYAGQQVTVQTTAGTTVSGVNAYLQPETGTRPGPPAATTRRPGEAGQITCWSSSSASAIMDSRSVYSTHNREDGMTRRRLRTVAPILFAAALAIGTPLAATGTAQAFQSSHSCSSLSPLLGGSVTGTHCLGGQQGVGPIGAIGYPLYICGSYSFGPEDPVPYFETITGYGCTEE
jgi:hypothetical protein